ncbi:MAG: IclR family transcriptional regulator [Vulcanimicrobiaceae bacterium]
MNNDLLGSVRRALRVLEYVADAGAAGRLPRSIATDLGINLSTVYHVLNTLTVDGYIVRDTAAGAYRLGGKAAGLGVAFLRMLPVTPQLQTIVRELSDVTNESAYLALLYGRDVVIAEIVESQQHVRVSSLYPGYTANLHARALGKAVLAHCDAAFIAVHFAAHPPVPVTRRTQTSLAELQTEFGRIRELGFSEDNEEFAEGVRCIGAPFFGAGDRVRGAFSVSIPAFRFRAARTRARAAVIAAARAATDALAGATRSIGNG